jgi:FecR protein
MMARSTLSDRRTETASGSRRTFRARRSLTILTVIAAIAALVVVGVVAARSHATLAQLRVRSGNVEVDHAAKGFKVASDGLDVTAGDIIRTSSGAQAIVDYLNDTVTRLDAGTRITVRQLSDTKSGERIELSLADGRVWDHVRQASSSSDSFEVRLSNVDILSSGSTFVTDCRRTDACYVVDFDGTTHLSAAAGDQVDLDVGQCESIARDGSLSACDPNRLGLVDGWVRANLAEDQELVTNEPAASPSPSPSPSPSFGSGSSGGGSVHRPVATRAPLRTPSKTAPPSTSTPAPTNKPKLTFPPTPTPHHRPRGSANP